MDGENAEKPRKIRRRKERWSLNSMTSQRIEHIISRLMQPVNDLKENFDTQLASLLEEYLTEVGLHHLENVEDYGDVQPNFSEIALLIQQSALIYSKKVDYLYQNVLDMYDSIAANSSFRESQEEAPTQTQNKRKRKISESNEDFQDIELEEATNTTHKNSENLKQPLRLPKSYIEFEPRVISDADMKLIDYNEELIGVINDFHGNWYMDESGMLVDDLDSSAKISREMLVPLNIRTMNLIPDSIITPPESSNNSDCDMDNNATTQLTNSDCDMDHNMNTLMPLSELTPLTPSPEDPTQQFILKKRPIDDTTFSRGVVTNDKTADNAAVDFCSQSKRLKLDQCSFQLPIAYISKVIKRRTNKILRMRRKLANITVDDDAVNSAFAIDTFRLKIINDVPDRFHMVSFFKSLKMISSEWNKDCFGFGTNENNGDFRTACRGFSEEEQLVSRQVNEALEKQVRLASAEPTLVFSNTDDDDGFFDQSTYERSQEDNFSEINITDFSLPAADQAEITKRVEAWHAFIRPRLEEAEKRSEFNVHNYSRKIIDKFDGGTEIQFSKVVTRVPKEDISRFLLATLMLANTGNVEIEKPSTPLAVGDFKIKLLTSDDALYQSCSPFE